MSVVTYFEPISKKRLYEFFAEFGGTEESVKHDLETLKEWMRKMPHLPVVDDDEWLLNFLLKCKNSLERTKCNLEEYFITKASWPDIFQNRDPCAKEMELLFQNTVYIPCPKLTSDGYRIVIFKAFSKTENFIPTGENILRAMQLIVDVLCKMDTVRGYILIEDLGNLTPAFIAMMIPIMNKFVTLLTKTTPHRLRKIYLVNTAPYMDVFIKLARSFLSNKLNERMVVWRDDITKFADVLPKEVLPSDLGGYEKPLVELKDLWYEEVKKHREWLKYIESYQADLDKIPKGSSHSNIQCDMNGSFRKLRID